MHAGKEGEDTLGREERSKEGRERGKEGRRKEGERREGRRVRGEEKQEGGSRLLQDKKSLMKPTGRKKAYFNKLSNTTKNA